MTAATEVSGARRRAGLTQRELARRSGVQQPTLSAIERGQRIPRPETLKRILDAARRRPSEVLDEHREAVLRAGARHQAGDIRVFGSIARGTDTADSDVDLLVRFDDGATYFDLVALTQELEALLEVRVDVVSDFGSSRTLTRARAEARPV